MIQIHDPNELTFLWMLEKMDGMVGYECEANYDLQA